MIPKRSPEELAQERSVLHTLTRWMESGNGKLCHPDDRVNNIGLKVRLEEEWAKLQELRKQRIARSR